MARSDQYNPLSARRRWLIALLAVVTAVTIVLTLLYPPGGVKRARAPAAVCEPGQTQGCVGGQSSVYVPAPAAASAAGRR